MLYTSRGIVLHQIRYSESSVIVKIFTEVYGLKSYIFKGVHKKKASVRSSLLQHLNLVELVCDDKDYGGLQHPKELRLEYPYHSLNSDIRKSSIALFINEILLHAIRHEEADSGLFAFLHDSFVWLDRAEGPVSDFHLWLCIQLTSHLGFEPQETDEAPKYFSLKEGLFREHSGILDEFMDEPCTAAFHRLLNSSLNDLHQCNLTHGLRLQLLQKVITYFNWHIADFGEIQSHKILAEVLS
jgi:DNA repair protein RecO (recombination protein O)